MSARSWRRGVLIHEIFIWTTGLVLLGLFSWAFKSLPKEEWQFIGSIPNKPSDRGWSGVNFTWYGFFAATAYAAGSGLLVLLMGSIGLPLRGSLMALGAILAICAPASRLIARWVEGSRFGFTVGGPSFVGVCVAPTVFAGMGAVAPLVGFETPLAGCLASLSIACVFGEGIGRLACISCGCCFGQPVDQSSGRVRQFSRRHHFVFTGPTKKIAFAASLEGVPVVPVQAMTASLHAFLTLCALGLFFEGFYGWVIPVTLTISQAWRAYSETFRADYRGPGTITAYQVMAAVAVALSALAPVLLPAQLKLRASLQLGLDALWSPEAVLALQGIWLASFVFMGRSTQTGSKLQFHVRAERT